MNYMMNKWKMFLTWGLRGGPEGDGRPCAKGTFSLFPTVQR